MCPVALCTCTMNTLCGIVQCFASINVDNVINCLAVNCKLFSTSKVTSKSFSVGLFYAFLQILMNMFFLLSKASLIIFYYSFFKVNKFPQREQPSEMVYQNQFLRSIGSAYKEKVWFIKYPWVPKLASLHVVQAASPILRMCLQCKW